MTALFPKVRIRRPMTRASWTAESGTVEETEDRLLVRDVFRLVFFLPHDHCDLAAGVSHALDIYVRAVEGRPSALSEYICGWWQPFKLGEQGWRRIRETLSPKERRFFEDYSQHEARSAEKDGASPYFVLYGERESGYRFDYRARLPFRETPSHYVSVLTITLPTELLEEQAPDFMRELILDMASQLPFASGHAGLSLDVAAVDFDGLAVLRSWMTRHPGFDLRNATIHDFMGPQVDGVHWINFLGQPVLGELGGVTGLRARLQSPATTVQEMEGERAVVTLGPRPEAGDLMLGQTLPEYRELARLLEPWQEPFNPDFLVHAHQADEEELRRWWRRFLD
jgi:TseV toxin immunity protein TsiV